MLFKEKIISIRLIFPVFIIIFLNACTDISNVPAQTNYISVQNSVSTTDESIIDEIVIITDDMIDVNIYDDTEIYNTYTFTDTDEKLINSMVFIGDSICMGFPGIDKSRILAQEGLNSNNITDIKIKQNNGETDVLTALVNLKPEAVTISMGMNDLIDNVTDKVQFCENYVSFIKMVKAYCPNSTISVLSITPVRKYGELNYNLIINEYNNALEMKIIELNDSAVQYIDITQELKNVKGELKSKYTSGDGIHITEAAYYAVLWQICKAN